MSASPKYSTVELDAQRARQVAEERRRQQVAERARAAAEQQRREQKRRIQATRALMGQVQACASLFAVDPALAAHIDRNVSRLLADELSICQASLQGILTDDQIATARQTAAALEQRANALLLNARHAKLKSEIGEAEAASADLRQRLDAVDLSFAEKFDASGRRNLLALLEYAQQALDARQPEAAAKLISEGHVALKEHQDTVQFRQQQWQQTHDRAAATLVELTDKHDITAQSPEVLRWAGDLMQTATAVLPRMQAALDAESFDLVHSLSAELRIALKSAEDEAARMEDMEVKRRCIVSGVLAALADSGLAVSHNPQLSNATNPRSDVLIHAVNSDGSTLALDVPLSGDMQYKAEGFSYQETITSSGKLERTCDDAETFIENFKTRLEDIAGIVTGELQWEGKEPDRIAKEAKTLSDSAPTQQLRLQQR